MLPEAISASDRFTNIELTRLDTLAREEVDMLPYGVVGMNTDYLVEIYSKTESRSSGIPATAVMGSHFFLSTAQCMNNFMVAQRFEDEAELDSIIDFVLTFRMRPTVVRLRLLQGAAASRRYILVEY